MNEQQENETRLALRYNVACEPDGDHELCFRYGGIHIWKRVSKWVVAELHGTIYGQKVEFNSLERAFQWAQRKQVRRLTFESGWRAEWQFGHFTCGLVAYEKGWRLNMVAHIAGVVIQVGTKRFATEDYTADEIYVDSREWARAEYKQWGRGL
jgi:hypothetical protein